MKKSPEVDKILELVCSLREQKRQWVHIAEVVNVEFRTKYTSEGVRMLYRRQQRALKQTTPAYDFASDVTQLVYENKKEPQDMTVNELLSGYKSVQDFRDKFSMGQSIAKVRINVDRPVAITAITDVHIGSPYTDYDSFERDISKIREHPHTFLLKGGDWADKFMVGFRDAAAPANQLQPATVQLLTVKRIMESLEGKIIAANGGNHDHMDTKKTGISTESLIHYDVEFPYLPEGGLVVLTVGDIEYNILWKHNYRGNSQISLFNAHRWLRELNRHADIAILEHTHNPGIEATERGSNSLGDSRTEINIRTGTYKLSDPFSERFFKTGMRGPETVVLFPDRRKVVPFHGKDAIEDAHTYMAGCDGD